MELIHIFWIIFFISILIKTIKTIFKIIFFILLVISTIYWFHNRETIIKTLTPGITINQFIDAD